MSELNHGGTSSPILKADPGRPAADEYGAYHGRYVDLVPAGNILTALGEQINETLGVLGKLTEADSLRKQPPYHWSFKEVIGHMADTERVFAYRALRVARNDPTPLPSFDQDDYVTQARFDSRPLAELVDDLGLIRQSTLALLRGLDPMAWVRRGTASGSVVSVRAIAHIIAGHEKHHLIVLRERVGSL